MGKENNRLIIMAGITAIMFGILQYIPGDKKFAEIGIELGLGIIAHNLFIWILPLIIAYTITFGLVEMNNISKREKTRVYNFSGFIYNLAITSTIIWIIFTSVILIGVKMIQTFFSSYPTKIQGYIFLLYSILFIIIFAILTKNIVLKKYRIILKKIASFTYPKIKTLKNSIYN